MNENLEISNELAVGFISPFSDIDDLELEYLISDNLKSSFFWYLVRLHKCLKKNRIRNSIDHVWNSRPSNHKYCKCLDSEVLDFCILLYKLKDDSKICPIHREWHKIYKKLPNIKSQGTPDTWIPPSPYVLGDWYDRSDQEKSARFKTHLIYAFENGFFDQIVSLMDALPEDQDHWHFSRS